MSKSKSPSIFLAVIAWIPLIAFAVPNAFAAIARFRVGHWPFYSHPDPKELALREWHLASLLAFPVAALSLALGFIGFVVASGSARKSDLVIFGVGAALWAFTLPWTGRLFQWLID